MQRLLKVILVWCCLVSIVVTHAYAIAPESELQQAPQNQQELLEYIKEHINEIKERGAFVFDVDGVLYSLTHTGNLDEPISEFLGGMLNSGIRVGIISANAKDTQLRQVVEPIVRHTSRENLKNFTIYVSLGALKMTYDENGKRNDELRHGLPPQTVGGVKEALEGIFYDEDVLNAIMRIGEDELRERFEGGKYAIDLKNTPFVRSSDFKPERFKVVIYDGTTPEKAIPPTKDPKKSVDDIANKPRPAPWIENRDGVQVAIKPIPDAGRDDVTFRKLIIQKLIDVIPALKEFSVKPGGGTSIDIQDTKANKSRAMEDYIKSERLDPQLVFYFGDQYDQEGVADAPLLTVEGIHCAAVCQPGKEGYNKQKRAKRIGDDFNAVHLLLGEIDPALAALDAERGRPKMGYLFDPGYQISTREGIVYSENFVAPTQRTAGEVLALLKTAEEKGIQLEIEAHLRGVDGPGSSLDLPEFQLALTKLQVKELVEMPSTPTMTSSFSVKIRFKLASDPEVIEYVAPDYGITEDNPYVVRGPVELTKDGKTPKGQLDGPAYIFANLFGLRGIRIELESISPMALAGGMESSNAFNVALFAAASSLSGQNWSLADIFSKAVEIENKELGGLTGGQGHLATMMGGSWRHVWLSGVKDANGNPINPYGAFSIPFLTEEGDIEFIEDHMALLQAGKEYRDGRAEARTAELINTMWTDLLRDRDPVGVELHSQKLALAERYTQALATRDMRTVVEVVNRYVDIRDELCRRWLRLALDATREIKPEGLPEYAKKYAQRLRIDPVLIDYHRNHGERLAEVSLYSDTAKELIQAAREEGIAIMPLGAGGPGANNIAITSNERGQAHLEDFFRRHDVELLNDEGVRSIMRGTGLLKGYMPFKISNEPIKFTGFEEIGLKEPAKPMPVQYNEKMGRFSNAEVRGGNLDEGKVVQAIDVSRYDNSGSPVRKIYLSEDEFNSLGDTLKGILGSNERAADIDQLFSPDRELPTGPKVEVTLTERQLENFKAYLEEVQYYRKDYGDPNQAGVVVAFSYGALYGTNSVNAEIASKIIQKFLEEDMFYEEGMFRFRVPVYAQWEIADLLYKIITGEEEINLNRQRNLNIFRIGKEGKGFYINTILVAQLFRNRGLITKTSFTCIGGINSSMSEQIYNALTADPSINYFDNPNAIENNNEVQNGLGQILSDLDVSITMDNIIGVIRQYKAFRELMGSSSHPEVDYQRTFIAGQAWHADRIIKILENGDYGLGQGNDVTVIGGRFADQFSPNDGQSWVRDVLQWVLKEGQNYRGRNLQAQANALQMAL